MKALRYLLIVMSMVSVLSVKAQSTAQLPQAQMQSTSVMVYSGSTLPQAAASGAMLTGSQVGTYTPAKTHPGHARRDPGDPGSGGGGDWEDDELTGEQTENPWKNPIGDAVWPLALLALAYVCARAFRRKRA